MTETTPLLQVTDVTAGFGSNTVLHGINYTVREGEIAGIFGLNGAGKSVSMKVVAGVVPAWTGSVVLDGTDMTRMTPEKRVARGIANVPQGRQVFPALTVEQNLRLGAYTLRRRNRGRYSELLESMYSRFPVLGTRKGQLAGTMSGGEQASLAVARALMSEPRLVLIDEPSAGLAPKVVEELFETLREVNRAGVTLLLVEQNVTFGLKLVDSAHIMQRGRIVYEGAVASLDRDRVAEYLGIGRLLKPGASASLAKKATPDKPKRRVKAAPAPTN